ncbi:MAG: DUF374 domain-containing protein [Rickettsiales bacterium]|nr:DUF374 domain-containing protein [Rickettsiales bacterium]
MKEALKQKIRIFSYGNLLQKIICFAILSYMFLVYFTSRKKFINLDKFFDDYESDKMPVITLFWHGRLMMIPFFALKLKKLIPNAKFMTLASKHGDGKFVGKIMQFFRFEVIYGSTKNGRISSRGIDISGMKQIINGLKAGNFLGVTPDGPRGPAKKINGEIVNIARIANAKIVAISYSSSRSIEVNSWDSFSIPLPFSNLVFYCDDKFFIIDKALSDAENKDFTSQITNQLNFAEEQANKIAVNNLN